MTDKLPAEVYRSPRAYAEYCDLTPRARALLTDDSQKLTDYFKLLLERRLYPDGIRFSSHALPKRQAVWWGCLCMWLTYRPEPEPADREALRAALAWVEEPSEATRRACWAAARAAGFAAPAGGLALAVFMTGGSVAPAGAPEVPPRPRAANRLVATAVLNASRLKGAGPRLAARQQQFLKLAHDVAQGKMGWEARPHEGERPRRPGGVR